MLSKSTYSFGADSPMKFELSDRFAKTYNEAVDEFLKAQQRFNQRFGRKWDPDKDPIGLRFKPRHYRSWNEFAKILARHAENDGRYHANDFLEDFLVKNGTASKPRITWGRLITAAVVGGAIYSYVTKR